jgi:predicted regulator of Ras-like GTPase activity (Roadblock/LC7/MglB family)
MEKVETVRLAKGILVVALLLGALSSFDVLGKDSFGGITGSLVSGDQSASATIKVGSSETFSVDGKVYEVTVVSVGDREITLEVNGEKISFRDVEDGTAFLEDGAYIKRIGGSKGRYATVELFSENKDGSVIITAFHGDSAGERYVVNGKKFIISDVFARAYSLDLTVDGKSMKDVKDVTTLAGNYLLLIDEVITTNRIKFSIKPLPGVKNTAIINKDGSVKDTLREGNTNTYVVGGKEYEVEINRVERFSVVIHVNGDLVTNNNVATKLSDGAFFSVITSSFKTKLVEFKIIPSQEEPEPIPEPIVGKISEPEQEIIAVPVIPEIPTEDTVEETMADAVMVEDETPEPEAPKAKESFFKKILKFFGFGK